jgi:aryl-alcohol dehydrogenase-like predicted oxidoreductase
MDRLALGTAQFGMAYGIANSSGQVSLNCVQEILALARANRINTIDTAIAYGESESALGATGAGGFRVITKLPHLPEGTADLNDWIYRQVADSLQRLQVDSVYGLLLHRSWQLADGRVRKSLEQLKEDGVVKKIGVSIYSPDELDALSSLGAIDLVQAPFNLVDRRLSTSGWLARLHDSGVEIHSRSAFLQGLLLMPEKAIPERFSPWKALWRNWHNWISSMDITAIQACLGYVLSFPKIDRIVVGVDSLDQLRQLIDAAKAPIAPNAFPDISTTDEKLINPSYWTSL